MTSPEQALETGFPSELERIVCCEGSLCYCSESSKLLELHLVLQTIHSVLNFRTGLLIQRFDLLW